MRWPHIHRDPAWKRVGNHRLYQCRCGARRVRTTPSNLEWILPAEWHDIRRDRHGSIRLNSGWRRP
jgi:hypothetical protein